MKRIQDFIAGKIHRSELQADLHLELAGENDPVLGVFEGQLESTRGGIAFYAAGLRIHTGEAVRYAEIERVVISPVTSAEQCIDIVHGMRTLRLNCSPQGATVVYATLRWVGHALLHRKLTD